MISPIAFCPCPSAPLTSPASRLLNGSLSFQSGCWGATAFTRSRAKASWKYIGCSDQRVPSLSKTAMRSAAGTKVGAPAFVTSATNFRIACFDGPSFQEGSGSVCAAAETPTRRATPAKAHEEPDRTRMVALYPRPLRASIGPWSHRDFSVPSPLGVRGHLHERLRLVGHGEQERVALRPGDRPELGNDAEAEQELGLGEEEAALEADAEHVVLLILEQDREPQGALVARDLELAVVDEPHRRDLGNRGPFHLLEEALPGAALQGQDVARLEVRVFLVRVELVGGEERRGPGVLVVEAERRPCLEVVRPLPQPAVVVASELPLPGGEEHAEARDVVRPRLLPPELDRRDVDVGELEAPGNVERGAFDPRLHEREGQDLAAPVAAQYLLVGHPGHARPEERCVDARMCAEGVAVRVVDRVRRVEVDREEDVDPRRRLAAVLHAGEAGDVVALELGAGRAGRPHHRQDREGDEGGLRGLLHSLLRPSTGAPRPGFPPCP